MLPFDYEDIDHRTCYKCHEQNKICIEARDFVEEIVKQLYTPQSLNMDILCHCIEELCHVLDIKMPKTDIQICQTDPKTWVNYQLPYVKTWIENNNKHLAKTI